MTTPNPTPTTLREILEQHRIWMRGIRVDRLEGTSSDQTARQILEQLKALLPEKKNIRDEAYLHGNTEYIDGQVYGFNQAIQEIEKAIEEWAK